jgi:hypothetical protein
MIDSVVEIHNRDAQYRLASGRKTCRIQVDCFESSDAYVETIAFDVQASEVRSRLSGEGAFPNIAA